MNDSVCPTWDALVVGYLARDVDLSTLYKAAKRPLARIAARLAPSMPKDLHEDAVQQLFVRLIENPPQYDPAQCSPRTLMFGLIRNAVRQVQSMFVPPGRKTRIDKSEFDQEMRGPSADLTAEYPTAEDGRTPRRELEQTTSRRWTAKAIEARAEAGELLARMTDDGGTAIWLVYGLQYSVTEAASIMNKSRFAVARSVKKSLHSARPETHPPRQLAAHSISVAA
jgi:RNA polymerase sigma factor (sigma-70 family)